MITLDNHISLYAHYSGDSLIPSQHPRKQSKTYILVEHDCIMLQGEDIVREDDDFIISMFMVTDQKLASTELVWIHPIQQLRQQRETNSSQHEKLNSSQSISLSICIHSTLV